MPDNEPCPCTFHPTENTRLRCAECERPVCPKCMVQYEVGFKCPDCARKRPSHMEQVVGWHFPLVGFLAAVAGFAYGWLHLWLVAFLPFRPFGIPVLAFLLAYVLGQGVGKLLQRLIRFKINRRLSVVAMSGAALGLLLSPPILVNLAGLLVVLMSEQNPLLAETSIAFYIVQGLSLLGAFLFVRGLGRVFRSPF